MPAVFAAWLAGAVDRPRVLVFHRCLADLSERVVATLIAQYRPDGPGTSAAATARTTPAPSETSPADTSSAARATSATEPVRSGPTDIGSAAVESDTAAAAGPNGARAGIEIRVALSTLLGRDDHPGEIPGLGLLTATATRARVAQQGRAEWRFAVTDATGRLLSEGILRRRPRSVGGHPVPRDGAPGGIVELHLPAALLHELVAGDSAVSGEWARVIADVAAQHARRDDHLADLDAHPARRFPTAALRRHTEIRDRT